MQTVRGFFDGKNIELFDQPPTESETHVLVVFLEGGLETAAAREQRLGHSDSPIRPPHVYSEKLRHQIATQYRRFTVGAIMTRDIAILPAGARVTSALNLMRHRGITSILVEPDENGNWAIMTMRDVLRHIVVASRSPDELTVSELATKPLIKTSPDTTLRECARLMLESNVRRIVIHQDSRPIGIVSDTDILQFVEERGWGPEEEDK